MKFWSACLNLTILSPWLPWTWHNAMAQPNDMLTLSRRRLRRNYIQHNEDDKNDRVLGDFDSKDREFIDDLGDDESKSSSKNTQGSKYTDDLDDDESKSSSKNTQGSKYDDYDSPSLEPTYLPSKKVDLDSNHPSLSPSLPSSSMRPSIFSSSIPTSLLESKHPSQNPSSIASSTNIPTSQILSNSPSQNLSPIPSFLQSRPQSNVVSTNPSSLDNVCGMSPTTRKELIFDILKPVSGLNELGNSTSSAGMAFDWLIDEDAFFICPDDEKIVQRYVLAKLYFQTTGDTWLECSRPSTSQKQNPSCFVPEVFEDRPSLEGSPWLNSTHECNWAFVTCDIDLCVTRIEVDENSVSGSIINEIDYLTQLEVFTMDGTPNAITGTIPTQFGNITSMRILDLDENSLTGTIPEELYQLINLEQLGKCS